MEELESVDVCVPEPCLIYTVTVEKSVGNDGDVRFHAGGQVFWVSRMARSLGASTTPCSFTGGEPGTMLGALVRESGVRLHAVPSAQPNGGYIHDRRSCERETIIEIPAPEPDRHALDDLVNATLTHAATHKVIVLCSLRNQQTLDHSVYEMLVENITTVGGRVVADLSGEVLDSIPHGLAVLKIAHDELIEAGLAKNDDEKKLLRAAKTLREYSKVVIISRAGEPALAVTEEGRFVVDAPRITSVDSSGAGDSMTGACAVASCRGVGLQCMLELAGAADVVNVARSMYCNTDSAVAREASSMPCGVTWP